MNILTYGSVYSKFHGCFDYRVDHDMLILDFLDMAWDPWIVVRFHTPEKVYTQSSAPLLKAFKNYFKTEAPCTVFLKQDSWSVLMGKSRVIMPARDEESATLHLYSTPYFVRNPSIVEEHMQGTVRSAYENFYSYQNCVMYLDAQDLPRPGLKYFEPGLLMPLYRLCFLSSESASHVASIAAEWKNRRNIIEIPFLTGGTIPDIKGINFQPVPQPRFPDTSIVSHGNIHKRRSLEQPHCLIHDVLASYSHSTRGDEAKLKNLGLLMQWPLQVTFEGTKVPSSTSDSKQVVALTVNGHRPDHVIEVPQTYSNYIEYSHVPETQWISVSFVPAVLELPNELRKVSVDAVVIGFVYLGSFFCFGDPVLEGRPPWVCESNIDSILTPVRASTLQIDRLIRVVETFRLDDRYSLHRIAFTGVPFGTWCISESNEADAYAKQLRLPHLVKEWSSFFRRHHDQRSPKTVNVNMVKLALVLAKHKICFQVRIDERKKSDVTLSGDEITLTLSQEESDFVNQSRLYREDSEEEKGSSCAVM